MGYVIAFDMFKSQAAPSIQLSGDISNRQAQKREKKQEIILRWKRGRGADFT